MILLMAIRKQIIVPDDVDARLRRIASERGLSQSALIVEAIRALPDASEQLARTLSFAGSIKGGSPKLSEQVDETLYGESPA
jgi:predicted transcriptional regulator